MFHDSKSGRDHADLPLAEPFVVPDVHVAGVAYKHELSPGLFRVALYTVSRATYEGGTDERTVVIKLIATAETLAMLEQTLSTSDVPAPTVHAPNSVN